MILYTKKNIEYIENPEAFISPSPYPREINLIRGKSAYAMEALFRVSDNLAQESFNTSEESNVLTDCDIDETANTGSPKWFRFSHGFERTITFRFDYLSAVSRFEYTFLRNEHDAVLTPRKVTVLLSENGSDWEQVVNDNHMRIEKGEKAAVTHTSVLAVPRKALYVRFRFDVDCHVWCGNLAVYGSTFIDESAKSIPNGNKDGFVNEFPKYEDFLGIHNLMLSYNCVPRIEADGITGLITEEQYLPYVAYLDKNMQIKDTMFDAFLYLPYVSAYRAESHSADGWHYYIDNCFAKNANVEALDKTAGTVKKALNKPDYQLHVFFSIFKPAIKDTNFGDLLGNGTKLNFSKLEDRKSAIKWSVSEYVRRFKEKNAENIKLSGFYWFEEGLNFTEKDEFELVQFASEVVHSYGLTFFWIPFYSANGYNDWKEAGFDFACLQPGYAFDNNLSAERLFDNAYFAHKFGLCVEMESSNIRDPFNMNKFRNYMDCGAETGYMNSVKMYYQGGIPGHVYITCHSDDPECRAVYDDWYLYAKEKYISRNER